MALVEGAPPEHDPDEGGDTREQDDDPWAKFTLPYSVATVPEYELRAYFQNVDEGEEEPEVEWLWARVHAYCQIQAAPGRMLWANTQSVASDLAQCKVPNSEYKYMTNEEAKATTKPWKTHTLGSRCLLVGLMWMLKNRTLKKAMKKRALVLLLGLTKLCLAFSMGEPFMGMLVGTSGDIFQAEIHLEAETWLCRDSWADLVGNCPGAVETWNKLAKTLWLGHCITSPLASASFGDILFMLVWLYCHPNYNSRGQNLFRCLVLQTLPQVINKAGKWLDTMAKGLAKRELTPLPTLETKTGQARKCGDPVNRLILLKRMRKLKLNRASIATSHEDLGSASTRMMRYEAYLDCMLHSQSLLRTFHGQRKQLSVAWDPSSYNGKDTLVAAAYHPSLKKACWLMNQQLGPVMMSHIHESLLPAAHQRKLTRVDGFKELRGLSGALRSLNIALVDFATPKGLFCRPLEAHEFRIPSEDGSHYVILDEKSGTIQPEIPPGLELGDVPLLVSISDQGPSNTAALNFIQFSSQAPMVVAQYDVFHRAWNDIKLAFKKTSFKAWKILLRLTMVANIPYGPYGSSQRWFKKRCWVEDFLTTQDVDNARWQELQHLICTERRMDEPKCREDAKALFEYIGKMPSILEKGPLIKLMRWFSFFESMAFLDGQLFLTKLILAESIKDKPAEASSADEAAEAAHLEQQMDDQKELQALKKRRGILRLAPEVITEATVTAKDCMMSVAKATWKHHAARAREVKSPLQVQQLNIASASSRFWASELEEMLDAALWDKKHLQHVLPEFCMRPEALSWHCELLEKLIANRAMSLVAFNELPPNTYHHSLATDAVVAKSARDKAVNELKVLLQVEAASNQGAVVGPLADLHWRFNPAIRTLMLAYEQDRMLGREGAAGSQARKLQEVLAQTLGDSRIIEVGHQQAKDLLRSAKTKTFANTTVMAKLLASTCVKDRNVDTVKVESGTKVQAPARQDGQLTMKHQLTSQNHKLPKSIQELMLPKGRGNQWPSPSPAALFQSAASTAWVFEYWKGTWPANIDCNSPWVSVCALPGAVMAQQSTGSLMKVIAAAEYSFLGWSMDVQHLSGEGYYLLKPERVNLRWWHLLDLDDWVVIPTQPVALNSKNGSIGWQRDGNVMSVELALCAAGLPINMKQLRGLVKMLGGPSFPANASRKDVEGVFFGHGGSK